MTAKMKQTVELIVEPYDAQCHTNHVSSLASVNFLSNANSN